MNPGAREAAVAYLLDELDELELAAFQTRLDTEPGLRSEVDALRPVVGRLDRMDAAAWDETEPPAPPPVVSPARPRRRLRLAVPAWGVALASVVLLSLAVVVSTLLAGAGAGPGTPASRAVALQPVGPAGAASGQVRLRGGEAMVELEDLPATGRDEFYELWLLSTPTDLVSLGSFRVSSSGTADLRVPVPVEPRTFRYLDVSLEPADGNPAHSRRSVLRGTT